MATFTFVNMSIVTSGAQDLTAFLNLPDDMVDAVKKECIMELRGMMGVVDNTQLPAVDSPQPRE